MAVCLSAIALGGGAAVAVALGEPSPTISALSAPPQAEPGVEIESERTANSQTFQLSDGSLETRIFASPINYPEGKGQWEPIGSQLEEGDGATLTNGDNLFDVQLPNSLGDEPVVISSEGEWVSYDLLGEETDAVQLEGSTATYEAPGGELSFEFSALANGLKEEIVLLGPAAPGSIDFQLAASAGLAPSLAEDGSLELRDGEDELVFSLPTPIVSDSSDEGANVSEAVHYELASEGEGAWRLTVRVDPDWLADPERVWPVRIDPTLTVPSPSLDCTFGVTTGPPGWGLCGSGGYQTLRVGYWPVLTGPEEQARSLLKFPLEVVSPESYVEKATLGLYAPSEAKNTSGVEVRRVTKLWTSKVNWSRYATKAEGGTDLLWSQAGGDFTSEGTSISTSERGAQAGWWNFTGTDLVELVRRWRYEEISNQGVLAKLQDDQSRECGSESCTQRSVEFASSAAADSSKRPYLALNYHLPSPNGTVSSPSQGAKTAGGLILKANWPDKTASAVTFQVMAGKMEAFEDMPSELVLDDEGEEVNWPMAVDGKNEDDPIYFDAAAHPQLQNTIKGTFQVRAIFEGTSQVAGYSKPVKVTLDRAVGAYTDAPASVGPGSVDLLTGNFTVSRTDVSIPVFSSGLEFSRAYSSRGAGKEPEDAGLLGWGWSAGTPVEAGGSEWRSLQEVALSAEEHEEGLNDYVLITDSEGYEIAFEKIGESYAAPPEASGWLLSRLSATQFALTDPAGNRTIFEVGSAGQGYLPVSVTQPGGSTNATSMVYTPVNGKKRLSMVIGPSAAGVSCTSTNATTTLGCRSLTFTYKAASTWGAPSSYGDRLYSIKYYGPNGSAMGSWEVARYAYDAEGRLIEEWDPRLSALKEAYTYEGPLLQSIRPPGEEPWTMDYYPAGEEAVGGRLKSASRPSLLESPATAQTTVVYGVPLSGSGAPYGMSGEDFTQWGQGVPPMDATAIFPPDQVPTSEPPSSYSRATVFYMDAAGRLVNTATPSGAGTSAPSITTAESDEYGNVVRELSAQNRLRALAAGAESVTRSHELETKRVFQSKGTEMSEEWGPLHEVRLSSGEIVQARFHRTVKYDEGAPTPPQGTPPAHFPTSETTGAAIPGQGTDADQRTTQTKYNWTLRKPTDTIVDPAGLNLRTHIAYDASSGLPTERQLPAGKEDDHTHVTKTIYYSAGSSPDASCKEKPQWANLPCKVTPDKQPGTEGQPEILVTRFASYNQLGQPTEVIESPGGKEEATRKTTTVYDNAGRMKTTKQEGGGTPVPTQEALYWPTTGRLKTTRFKCEVECTGFDVQAITTTYDTLGRPTAYTDADAKKSTTTYDLLGRPVSAYDTKGTQTMTYDPTSGLLISLADTAAGTFTASYDADGNLVERGLPNGLMAKTTYNEAGEPTGLSYDKVTNCSSECTWLSFSAERSIYGQVLSQASTLSSQEYAYDKEGRLTLVKDTPQGGGCTTRSYGYDADSNRTALVTRAPGVGGACDTTSAGTTQTYSYDAADRLVGSEISYDSFGRITSLPGTYAGGGTLSTSYYSNEIIATQSQGGVTNSYQLDSAGRPRELKVTGSKEVTEVFHYSGGSDSPSWIASGSAWTRNIGGIGGELAAIQDSATGTSLQLVNLHGDIVATASLSQTATKPTATFEFDEFGNPKSGGAGRFGWLGGKLRRTELPSGVIQMGVRSYVSAMGRFISTDPIVGGSASAYDYGEADPINNLDLTGTQSRRNRSQGRGMRQRVAAERCTGSLDYPHRSTHNPSTVNVTMRISCVGNIAVKGWMEVSLFYSPTKHGSYQQVASTGKVNFQGVDFTKKIHANSVCKPGWYRAVGGYFAGFPPGSVPPYSGGVRVTRQVHVSCA